MTLHKFVAVLRRRKWMVVAVLLLALLGSGALSAFGTRTYTATAGVYFSVRTAGSVNDLATAATFSQSQMASYATLAMTPEVLDPVATELGVRGGGGALAGQLSTTAVAGTVLLDVSAVDTDPARAARIADAVARRLITVVEDLSPGLQNSDQSAVEATVVTPASTPSSPTSPKVELNLVAGAVLGLGLGILLALAREALDTRVRRPEDVAELTRAPVLGSLGIEPGRRRRVLMEAAPHSPQAEAYRQLRTNLQFLELGEGSGAPGAHRTISVTSSLAAEGKSTVAINLAVALAETGARVLLVDADLRRPTIASVLGLEGAAGLTTVLLGQAGLDDVAQPWGSAGLHVLPAGPLPPNPTELLGSVPMRRLLGRMREQYDYVVLDSAPLLPVADSAVIAGLVDGTLLLVNATKARRHQVAESVRNLARVEAPVLGVVLNQVARDERSYGYWATEEPTAVPSEERLRQPGAPAPVGR